MVLLGLLLLLMTVDDVFPQCDTDNNNGVMPEFGSLPDVILDDDYFRPVHREGLTSRTLSLTGYLYKVEYHEYMSVYGAGNDHYGYVTLYFWDQKTSAFKTLDFLRVDRNKWKNIKQAIVYANYKDDHTRSVTIKFSTSDCKCIQRIYSLDASDAPSEASTKTCNGDPMMTPPHLVSQEDISSPWDPDVTKISLKSLYPGCDVGDNAGVLDVFGPLPIDLNDVRWYYQVDTSGYVNHKFKLWELLEHYEAMYSEYRDQRGLGKVYSFLSLYYIDNNEHKLLDYLRVHPKKWDDIQAAMIWVVTPDAERKLKLSYLTADCTCRMREYDLNQVDIVGTAVTRSCDGQDVITSSRTTVVEEQEALKRESKANYELWSLKKSFSK